MDISAGDIPDSSDWLNTPVAPLSTVEAALRCQVCKDFFNTPMITTCSHTFCSICIRRCLTSEGKCPTCRGSDQELRLRKNNVVEELVEAFQAARPIILQLGRDVTRMGDAEPDQRRKRKYDDAEYDENEISQRITRSRSRKSPRIQRSQPNPEEDSAGKNFHSSHKDDAYLPEDGLAACPICNKRMKVEEVFLHLDTHAEVKAPSSGAKTLAFGKNPTTTKPTTPSRQERLPALNYSVDNETRLRKKLAVLGIPSHGNKQQMIRRHTEWVNLWNANCDSSRPKNKSSLLQELAVWERTQGTITVQLPGASNSPGSVMAKDFDRGVWSSNHGNDFKSLIEQARKAKAKKESSKNGDTPLEADKQSTEGAPSQSRDQPRAQQRGPPPRQELSAQMPQHLVIDLDGEEDETHNPLP